MVDPSKMEAYVNEGGGPPEEPMEGEGGEGEGGEGGGGAQYSGLIPLLVEFSEDVQDSIDEMDPDVLEDTSMEMAPDDETILGEAVSAMDRGLVKELKAAGGMSPEDADFVAESLVDEGAYDEPTRLSGWLQRVTSMFGGAPEEEGEAEAFEGEETPEEEALEAEAMEG